MADTDPAATLHALANYFRKYDEVTTLGGVIAPEFRALAEHVEGVARMKVAADKVSPSADIDIIAESLLAVAAAAGITA